MNPEHAKKASKAKNFLNPVSNLFIFLCFASGGCTGLNLTPKEVAFESPAKYFNISSSEEDIASDQKVLLRLKKPSGGVLRYEEKTCVFAGIQGEKGIEFNLDKKSTQIFQDLPDNNVWKIKVISQVIDQVDHKSVENYWMDDRGAILKLIDAEHISENGKIRISEWKREPIFPEKPVRPGDRWAYEEYMKMELNSFWVSRHNNEPYRIKAKCEFANFAVVNGRKCAVIKTRLVENRDETLSTFLKKMELNINSFLNEIAFFDYQNGIFIGRIVGTESFTFSKDGDFSDQSKSQTIWKLSD